MNRLADAVLLVAALGVACTHTVAPAPAALPAATPATIAGSAGAAACRFTNPVLRGADPSIVRQGGSYYLVQSRGERIVIYKAARLEALGRAEPVAVFTAPDTGWNHANIWAPELAYLDGHWYIYYAAAHRPGQPFTDQRSGVLRARTDDPLGMWEDMGPLFTGDGPARPGAESIWAIDLTVGRVNGQLYAVWSGWEHPASTDKTPQLLYIAPMANPWTITGSRRVLAAPNAPWERGPELDLQEGPEFLEHDGRTFVVYSTRDSWLPTYELGMLRYKGGGADPTDSASWAKSAGPVFAAANGVIGVGHHTFTESPDGRQDWLVYHAKTSPSPGWDRVIHMQPFTWRADSMPVFGAPLPNGVAVTAPSGECG